MPNGVPVSWMSGFWRHSPVVAVSGSGSVFTDLDGNTYRDFNLCDLAMAAGFAPPPIVDAIADQAALGNHFLLPTTDALEVSRLLRETVRSASLAVHPVGVRGERRRPSRCQGVHRPATCRGLPGQVPRTRGRDALVRRRAGRPGPPDGSGAHLTAVPFNDLAALEAVLAGDDIAAVLLEPVMTNCGLVMPQPGFHAAVRSATQRHGTLVIADVTHTQFAVHGGGAQEFGLDPDIITGGKGIGGGMPVGVFGMTASLADFLADHVEGDFTDKPSIPPAAPCMPMPCRWRRLEQDWPRCSPRTGTDASTRWGLGCRRGCRGWSTPADLGLTIDRWGGRCQWRLTTEAPVNGSEGYGSVNEAFADARKAFLMNRGIWDAIATPGPAISFAATSDDVDAYLEASEEFLAALQ